MPQTSNNPNLPGESLEPEDIFSTVEESAAPTELPVEQSVSDVVQSQVAQSAELQDAPPQVAQPPVYDVPERRNPGSLKRILLIIAIVVVGLVVLSGIGYMMYGWWQQRPTTDTTDTANTNENANQVIENTNTSSNLNITPLENTNTVVETPTTPGTFVDTDHDGLSDEEELINNTNPKKKDTDEDGLSDREEVRVYLTDPRNPDTDGDTYTDGTEVANFYHPNDPDPKKRLFELPN